jgi:alpha-glucosidase
MLSKAIGDILKWNKTTEGVEFSCEGFEGSVSCCTDQMFRIRIQPNSNEPKSHSYALLDSELRKTCAVTESSEYIYLKTNKASVEIKKAPFRIRLFDEQNQLLSSDDDAFGTSVIGSEVTTYRALMPGERFIGLGEKVGPVDRRGHAYTNYNTDKFAYSIEEDPLYLSVPFFIGVHDKGTYGLFLDNTFKTRFNFGASTDRFSWFSASNGEMDYYLIAGGSVADIIAEYAALTGRMPMPPKWSLGFQQCRYSYFPEEEVTTLAQTFRDKDIPADVIYLDIHYMEEYKAFTFDRERFPDPVKMHARLKEIGFKTVAIVDPGIKVQEGYGPYDRGISEDVFVKLPDGERYQGEVWPSWSHFPDFTHSKVRNWWGSELEFYREMGVSGIWNDMNEPAAWGQCLPELIEFDNEGNPTVHAEVRNVYGMQMARATQEGMAKYLGNERPFVLTRAGFSGVQRYSAVWTGDNVSSDDHMLLSCRMLCSMGLTGIPFAGSDIGGFAGEASPQLYARWLSLGVFQPMVRAHTQVNTRDAEPWSFGEEVEQIARNYIKLRYRLMPYIYTAFKQAADTGLPLMRSMAIYHSLDALCFDSRFENQYYFGDYLLVCPARSTAESIEVYLPKGNWYDLYTDQYFEGERSYLVHCPIYKQPVFVRAGAVIPMRSQTSHESDQHDAILRLHVYARGYSKGGLYEDDGLSNDFTKGAYVWRTWEHSEEGLTIYRPEGNFDSEYTEIKLILHACEGVSQITIDDTDIALITEDSRWVEPISGIDTFYADKGVELQSSVKVCVIKNLSKDLKIRIS